jgi:hypothetical protein
MLKFLCIISFMKTISCGYVVRNQVWLTDQKMHFNVLRPSMVFRKVYRIPVTSHA